MNFCRQTHETAHFRHIKNTSYKPGGGGGAGGGGIPEPNTVICHENHFQYNCLFEWGLTRQNDKMITGITNEGE